MTQGAPITLVIETSNPGSGGSAGVALGKGASLSDSSLLGVEQLEPASRHDDALMPAIERLCARCNLEPKDISRVAVSIGPGGFTSVRIAVAAAKMIAEAVGAACIGVPTAAVVMRRVQTEQLAATVLLAWKREDVWRQRFRRDKSGWRAMEPGMVVPLASLRDQAELLIADAELQEMLRAAGVGSEMKAPSFEAAAVFEASFEFLATSPLELLPLYPREPEAVRKWRELGR